MTAILVVGCGYVGRRLARAEQQAGQPVTAVVRSAASAAALAGEGFEALRLDLDRSPGVALPTRDALITYLVPPPSQGVRDPRLGNFLSTIVADALPGRIVLVSTSGVYGDCGGEWVSEERAPQPRADRARRRLDAEQQLQSWGGRHGVPVVILRVPGIYGPGRLPRARLQSGEPVLHEAESPWSNRVHVDDLVRACRAAARQGRAGAVYNVSDGEPSTMTDYFNRVAEATGLPRPPQIRLADAAGRLSEGMRSYLAESKRLDNRRMRDELGVAPRYPDLASGLAACLLEEQSATHAPG